MNNDEIKFQNLKSPSDWRQPGGQNLKSKLYYLHLQAATKILTNYDGAEPFHLFIKKYFSENKKHGSKDRRSISDLCYNFFRLGKAASEIDLERRIILASWIVEQQNDGSDFRLKELVSQRFTERELQELSLEKLTGEIFPFSHRLSEGIDADEFSRSFLQRPDTFVRIRPGQRDHVLQKLQNGKITYTQYDDFCLGLQTQTELAAHVDVDKEVQVQDLSSQRTASFLPSIENLTNVWDCCAASGGKSIMAYDLLHDIELTVTDKRESILNNLALRFKRAGIQQYHSQVADLAQKRIPEFDDKFDLIIADLPCTGSGTWARTPEQLYFFYEKKIEEYARLQKSILRNVVPAMKAGAYLLYITCSVFKEENEEVVRYLCDTLQLRFIKGGVIPGSPDKADTMFASLLTTN